jgi:hypothetical protein
MRIAWVVGIEETEAMLSVKTPSLAMK